MKLPEVWQNKLIQDINMRKKYKLSIVFIKRGNKVIVPEPEMELLSGDTLVVAGENSKINAVANLINDASDIENQLNSVFGDSK
jgi:trk system potassium uptake protein TrkA